MKQASKFAVALLGIVFLAGCASTEVTRSESKVGDEKMPKPDRIIVQDFAASPSDVPSSAVISGRVADHSEPQTAEEVEAGRKLGSLVAEKLVGEINGMGLTAEHAKGRASPSIGDLVIRGYFVSIDEGSAAKRLLVGFGSGNAELRTVVEGFLMTDQGLKPLGSRELDAGGNKMPGVLVPLAVLAGTGNPIGLVVGGAAKVADEATGSSEIEGTAKRTAEEIAEELKDPFEKQGWL